MTKLEPGDLTGQFPSYAEWLDKVAHPQDYICRTQIIYNYCIDKFLIAKKLQPKIIVEIGVRLGYSAHAFLQVSPEATYIGMDLPGGGHGGTRVAGLEYVHKMLLFHFPKAKIELQNVNTQKLTKYEGLKPDLFHVDGDHSFQGAFHDLKFAWASGAAFILADDYKHVHEVKRAVDYFIKMTEVEVEFFDTVRGDVLMKPKKLTKA